MRRFSFLFVPCLIGVTAACVPPDCERDKAGECVEVDYALDIADFEDYASDLGMECGWSHPVGYAVQSDERVRGFKYSGTIAVTDSTYSSTVVVDHPCLSGELYYSSELEGADCGADAGTGDCDAYVLGYTDADTDAGEFSYDWNFDSPSDALWTCLEADATWYTYMAAHPSGDCSEWEKNLEIDTCSNASTVDPEDQCSAVYRSSRQTTTNECSPGSAMYRVMPTDWVDKDKDGTGRSQMGLLHVAGDTPASQAWIRDVQVLSWGSFTNLHLQRFGVGGIADGEQILSSKTRSVVRGSSERLLLPPRNVNVGALAAADGISDDALIVPMTLNVSWSCETDAAPHWEQVATPPIHGLQLSDLGLPGSGSLRLAVERENARLLLWSPGRFGEGLTVDLEPVGEGWAFELTRSMYGFSVSGTLTDAPGGMTLDVEELTMGGVPGDTNGPVFLPRL
jgi:hypothetical protein